jgi:hypothetical protein
MAPSPASLTWGASQAFRKAVRIAVMSSGRKLYSLGADFFGMIKPCHRFKFRNLQVCPARKKLVDCPVLTSEQMPTGRDRERGSRVGISSPTEDTLPRSRGSVVYRSWHLSIAPFRCGSRLMMVACCSECASVCSALLFRIAHCTRQGPNPEYLLGARASADRWEVGRGSPTRAKYQQAKTQIVQQPSKQIHGQS